ncbi:peptide MFS transporter [Novosphingobium sp.]|uniref:peptide MFS transporter n=1 Tax=Novosphingobium sp. TaxID=1874826 RepID=UPI0025CBBA48|nr:peptide MFS transporter [Novosphingobium sp.]
MVAATRTDLFGQPKGLWVLAGTELWDRISFHGMLAMLVLYMTGDLLIAPDRVATIWGFAAYRHAVEGAFGHLSNQALATQTFGLYYAGIAAMPLLGGWIADRFIGRRAAVSAGALLMTLGHFSFAFDRSFLLGLLLLVLGAGLLRGNLPAQVKSLYPDGDRRETTAFQYYYLGINTGAFIAPIVSGAVAAIYGWHAGFAVAGFGMLIGLMVYTFGQRYLPKAQSVRGPAAKRTPLTPDERRAVLGLLLVWPIAVSFWIAQAQIWNVYNIWLRDHVQMKMGSFQVPVPWMQSLDGLAPALFIPLVVWIWARQARRGREPDTFGKMSTGALIFAAGVLILSAGPLLAGMSGDSGGRAPLMLPILFHVVSNFGAMYFTPTALSLYATRAPAQWRGSLVGTYQLSVSAASLITGRMGQMYETMTPSSFWALNAAICAGGAVALVALTPTLRRLLGVRRAEDEGALVPKVDTEPVLG